MKKTLVLGGILLALFVLDSLALGKASEAAANQSGVASPAPREGPSARERDLERLRTIQSLQQQIDALKATCQGLVDELQPIHARAVREKATATAKQIETIISRRQERYQNQWQPLEQQLQRLQAAMKKPGPAGQTPEPGGRERRAVRGKKAPDFELDSFDGRAFRLSDYQGSVVVLEWLNTDCPAVKYHAQAKTMVNLANKYRKDNVVWLAINSTSQTTVEANRAFAKKYDLPYPILDDRPGQVGRLYGARKTPHLFIIDRDGYLVYDGAIDNAPPGKLQSGGKKTNYVEQALTELLSAQKVSVPATPPYGTPIGYPPVKRPK
jgi:peroxiredoxin/gas vesicle protein